jgi:hypothetical protein
LFSSFIGKKFCELSSILCLLSSTKVRQFFGSKFIEEKRSAAGDRNSKDISLENKEKNMCLAAIKITMKWIAVCLGFQIRITQRHLSPPPKASPLAIETRAVCPRIVSNNPEE